MGNLVNLTGKRFGKLTVTGQTKSEVGPCGNTRTKWAFRCDCGTEGVKRTEALVRSLTQQSCGTCPVECICCGKPFVKEHTSQKSCSAACAKTRQSRMRTDNYYAFIEKYRAYARNEAIRRCAAMRALSELGIKI